MKAYAKIDNWMATRKTPQTSAYIADYFLLSPKTVTKTLTELERMGSVKRQKVGRQYVWFGVNCN